MGPITTCDQPGAHLDGGHTPWAHPKLQVPDTLVSEIAQPVDRRGTTSRVAHLRINQLA